MPLFYFQLYCKLTGNFGGFFVALTMDKEIDSVESRNIDKEKQNHNARIKNCMTVYQIEENVVRCAVAPHKEHIVVVKGNICDVCSNTESK